MDFGIAYLSKRRVRQKVRGVPRRLAVRTRWIEQIYGRPGAPRQKKMIEGGRLSHVTYAPHPTPTTGIADESCRMMHNAATIRSLDLESRMRASLRQKIIDVCDRKIAEKGSNVGLSLYAFWPTKTTIRSFSWKRRSGGSEPTGWITSKKR